MKTVSESDLARVLLHCIDFAEGTGNVYKPGDDFFNSVKKMSESQVLFSLQALKAKGLIDISTADFPESRNIYYIAIAEDKAYLYIAEREESRRSHLKNWRWNIAAALITGFVSTMFGAIIGALLARVSFIFWP